MPQTSPLNPNLWRLRRRSFLWSSLVVLIVIGQFFLVLLSIQYEEMKSQEQVEDVAASIITQLKLAIFNNLRDSQSLVWSTSNAETWRTQSQLLMEKSANLIQLEYRNSELQLVTEVRSHRSAYRLKPDSVYGQHFSIENTCKTAERLQKPVFSPSYFNTLFGEIGLEVMNFCIGDPSLHKPTAYTLGTIGLQDLLHEVAHKFNLQNYEISFVDLDGARLARVGHQRGKGIFISRKLLPLEGAHLEIKVDSTASRPAFIPNLSVALVVGLSITLFGVVSLLLRDTRKRSHIQRELAQSLAFRRAMENSLSTGLRARDLSGRITYANPAFCRMVDYTFEQLQLFSQNGNDPPYWPSDRIQDYRLRQKQRHLMMESDMIPYANNTAGVQGFETEFIRKSGKVFPVMIYESPLLDHHGQHTGWMSAIVDITQQRQMEDHTRHQQERLQSIARLATIGEMASLLSHELNQPLAAIASYAHGSLNILKEPDSQSLPMIEDALHTIANQAERAGKVIRSVHDFVRRREKAHEPITVEKLMDAVLPLIDLQARKTLTHVEWIIPNPHILVRVDRIMIEQVLLNITRNGIQAMENGCHNARKILSIRIQPAGDNRVEFSITDSGPGITAEVASQLFTPFFTTRSEGMGMGLSLCRTVIEQHGGSLEFESLKPDGGCRFWFTLAIAQTH
jgi:two-component system sensor histidine kinase DctS